jgi:hypothetical protein
LICWRVAPIAPAVAPRERGGMLWFPRRLQGAGRHDNPDTYGCLYASEEPVGAIAEALAPFRGSGALAPAMLRRSGRALRLGQLALDERAAILDLDDPSTLVREGLRPSRVATRERAVTQPQAAELYHSHPRVVALRWWSTIESALAHLTIFDRGATMLSCRDERELSVTDPAVGAAADLLGLS